MERYGAGVNLKVKGNDQKRRKKTALTVKGQADFVSKALKAIKNRQVVMANQTATYERVMLYYSYLMIGVHV